MKENKGTNIEVVDAFGALFEKDFCTPYGILKDLGAMLTKHNLDPRILGRCYGFIKFCCDGKNEVIADDQMVDKCARLIGQSTETIRPYLQIAVKLPSTKGGEKMRAEDAGEISHPKENPIATEATRGINEGNERIIWQNEAVTEEEKKARRAMGSKIEEIMNI